MAKENNGRPDMDPSSAPESGTVRDETSGNNPSPPDRGLPADPKAKGHEKAKPGHAGDDVSTAAEAR